MKLALIGYGVMGQLVAKLAAESDDEVGVTLNSQSSGLTVDQLAASLRGYDVAIDFSIGAAVPKNVEACMRAQVPLVEGTTGWQAEADQIRTLVESHGGSLIYGSNFSLGVQVFYRLAKHAAEIFSTISTYDGFIEEAHHKRKRDAPSGTALQLRDLVQDALGRDVPVSSTRAGYIPGTHLLGFDSRSDQIIISHEARNREGFVTGALLAARWIIGRKGVYEFSEAFDEMVKD